MLIQIEPVLPEAVFMRERAVMLNMTDGFQILGTVKTAILLGKQGARKEKEYCKDEIFV
jgi:hypothetical protein